MKNQVKLAEAIARKAHEGKFRRDGKTPSIVHSERVATQYNWDGYPKCVAWLHDVLEDNTEYTPERLINEGVLLKIVHDVITLTRLSGQSYSDFILQVAAGSVNARGVKIADILDNLRDDPTPKQVQKYSDALKVLSFGLT